MCEFMSGKPYHASGLWLQIVRWGFESPVGAIFNFWHMCEFMGGKPYHASGLWVQKGRGGVERASRSSRVVSEMRKVVGGLRVLWWRFSGLLQLGG